MYVLEDRASIRVTRSDFSICSHFRIRYNEASYPVLSDAFSPYLKSQVQIVYQLSHLKLMLKQGYRLPLLHTP
jgi:hypothetical protein